MQLLINTVHTNTEEYEIRNISNIFKVINLLTDLYISLFFFWFWHFQSSTVNCQLIATTVLKLFG